MAFEPYSKRVLVLGCGNILFGDDGFGPETVEHFKKNYRFPPDVEVINAGCSVRNILFDVALADEKPETIIIVDAVDAGKKAGEIFEIRIEDLPEKKIDDFSMHQLPTSNLLRELNDIGGVKVKILVCQTAHIPEAVSQGLSEKIAGSIPEACEKILGMIQKKTKTQEKES